MMTPELQHLIDTWNERPARVEPDDVAHLSYIFTRLLPAMVAAMPSITKTECNCADRIKAALPDIQPSGSDDHIDEVLGLLRVARSQRDDYEKQMLDLRKKITTQSPDRVLLPSSFPPQGLVQESSTRIPNLTPHTADNGEASGQTGGISGTPASDGASASVRKVPSKSKTTPRAKASTKKPAAVLPESLQGTGGTGTV